SGGSYVLRGKERLRLGGRRRGCATDSTAGAAGSAAARWPVRRGVLRLQRLARRCELLLRLPVVVALLQGAGAARLADALAASNWCAAPGDRHDGAMAHAANPPAVALYAPPPLQRSARPHHLPRS
ncbi:unnamed protein product, partial [Urochloa humidicola]